MDLVAFAALDALDRVVATDLITGAALDALVLNDHVQAFGFADNGVGRTRFDTGVTAGAGIVDGVRHQFLADTGRAAFVANVRDVLLAEIADRGQHRIRALNRRVDTSWCR